MIAEEEANPPVVFNKSKVAKNTLIYLLGQVVTLLAALVGAIVQPYFFGPTVIGYWGLACTTVSLISMTMQLCIENYLTVEAGRDRAESGKLLRAALGLKLAIIPVFVAVCLLVVYVGQMPPLDLHFGHMRPLTMHFAHMPPLVAQTIYILTAVNCILFLGAPIVAVLTGWEQAKLVSLFAVMTSSALLVQVPFLKLGYIVAIGVWQAFGTLVPFYFQVKWARQFTSLRPTFDPKLWLRLVRGGVPFLANSLTLGIYSSSSIYLLRYFTNDSMVGTYLTAIRLVGISSYIPTAIYMAMLPSAVRLATLGSDELDEVQARTFKCIVICGFWCTAIAFLLGPPAAALIYLKKYPDIILIMQAGAFTIIPLFIVTTLYSFLVARGRNGIWSYFLMGTTVLNGLLCWVLIPWARIHLHNGAAGAVFAVAIAEAVTMVAAIALLKLNVFANDTIAYAVKTVAATALMCGVMVLMLRFCTGVLIVIPGIVGSIAFCAALHWLHVLDPEDEARIVGLVRGRLGFLRRKA